MNPIAALCIVLCIAVQEVFGARILGLFPAPIKSHLSVTSPVMHALAKKGHDVTMFVPFNTGFNASNYREITYEHLPITNQMDVLKYAKIPFVLRQFGFFFLGTLTTEMALNTTEAKDLMKSEEKYDVIVMEHFVNEAFLVFVDKFKCPVVLISTFGVPSEVNRIFGNPAPYSYVPSAFLSLGDRMTFFERLGNTLATIYNDISRKWIYMPRQQALAEKYLSDSGRVAIPSLDEIERQADFILVNSHHAFSTPRPYMPNMKDVAGMHLKPSKPLPSDLQQYLDSSKNGVILFSFGSAIQSISMPQDVISKLKGAFAKLPYDVLWKWENDTMENKPANIRIGKWLPQNDLLAHKNLKLFVTHGGISSTMETVYHGVPIVGIPVIGDQLRNALFAKSKGYGEILYWEEMTEDEIYKAVKKVMENPKYRENVKKISAYWRDEMNHPLDQAVHWVEYVIKHGGAKHLKAVSTELNFIQYFLIDVAFAIFSVLILLYLLISKTFRSLCKKSSINEAAKKTN